MQSTTHMNVSQGSFLKCRFAILTSYFRYDLNKDQVAYGLPTADIRGTILSSNCPLEVDFPCQPRKYRAFSGYCNNVQNPSWGNSNRRFVRFLAPDYADCK